MWVRQDMDSLQEAVEISSETGLIEPVRKKRGRPRKESGGEPKKLDMNKTIVEEILGPQTAGQAGRTAGSHTGSTGTGRSCPSCAFSQQQNYRNM